MRSVSSVLARCWARHAISRGDARVKRECAFGVESFLLSGGGEERRGSREKEGERERETRGKRDREGANPPTWNASRRVRKISSVGVIIKKYVSLQTYAHIHTRLGPLSSFSLTSPPPSDLSLNARTHVRCTPARIQRDGENIRVVPRSYGTF